MKYTYIVKGTKDNQPKEESYALDGTDQWESFAFFARYCSEDFDEVDNIEYTGKY
jgi:hypothetical protein